MLGAFPLTFPGPIKGRLRSHSSPFFCFFTHPSCILFSLNVWRKFLYISQRIKTRRNFSKSSCYQSVAFSGSGTTSQAEISKLGAVLIR